MRIRSIKPDFWRSDDIDALAVEDRLLFIGLWSYVDDNGVGRDRLASIAADLFAGDLERDSRETLARVSRGLSNLAGRNLLLRYEVDGRPFLAIANWTKHQRIDKAGKARYPGPDQAIQESLASSSRDSRETLAPGEGEKGRRGEEEEGKETPSSMLEEEQSKEVALLPPPPKPPRGRTYPEDFERFWSVYPRRDDKADAFRAWQSIRPATEVEDVIAGAERYRDDPNRTPQFTKLPATWLRAGSWENGPLPPRQQTQQARLEESHAETLATLHRMGVAG